MSIDEVKLLAYVDGTLTSCEQEQVEKQITASPEAALCVARLKASRLPYSEAFAAQSLPPVPEALARRILEMSRTRAPTTARVARQRHADSANDTEPTSGPRARSSALRSPLRVAPGWLAVAFAAGAFCVGAVLQLAPSGDIPGAGTSPVSPWVQAVAGYQQLYTRDTVASEQADPATIDRTIDSIRRDDGLPLRAPDLREAGLTFRQVQRLQFHGRPLVQLVYLPEKGEPVALCVMKQAGPDQAIDRQTVSEMHVVTWRQGELGYALVTASGNLDLAALGRRIAERGFAQLADDLRVAPAS